MTAVRATVSPAASTVVASPPRVGVVVGSARPGSRTRGIALAFAAAIRAGLEPSNGDPMAQCDVIDLSDLLPALGLHVPGVDPVAADPVTRALARTQAAQLLVVASPTLKGSYSGVLKHFLDLLPRAGLTGTVAVGMMTAASAEHRFAVDLHLRALLVELGARVPTRGLSVLERDFERFDSHLDRWLSENLPTLSALLAGAR
ncbi:NADPH-dependent FMN reductase [Micromonospora sp. DT48]|uniref:NADPH-dependent FMN reductase n=1 Tax=unclassified Micromonospora TaxID=2617518 RepID=UPI0012BD8018|nr:NAD(P)H-dependent oxidoreductase [Micromonospora sp. CP22]MTK01504.1 NAD(P)H-dependent oxidoreductase [Micromonospora sp. CP22]